MDLPPARVLSLCTGGGGLDLGLYLAGRVCGFEPRTLCYVEREISAVRELASRMADETLDSAPVWSDLRTFPGEAERYRGRVDILAGGYPCQPFSMAGQRRGEADPRHLWPAIRDTIGIVRPRLVFCENVPGHLRLGFDTVCEDLRRLGYAVAAGVYSAAEVGAAQLRRRLFFLASDTADREQHSGGGGGIVGCGSSGGFGVGGRTSGSRGRADESEPAVGGASGRGHPQPRQPGPPAPRREGAAVDGARQLVGRAALERHDWQRDAGSGRGREFADASRGFPGIAPPGRADFRAWAELLYSGRVDVAPVLPAQSEIRRMAHGMAAELDAAMALRTLRLAILGNGVYPPSAAVAFCDLWEKLRG